MDLAERATRFRFLIRDRDQRPVQPLGLDPARGQRVLHGATPAATLGDQGQLNQRGHRPVGAQQRLGRLEQRVRPRRT